MGDHRVGDEFAQSVDNLELERADRTRQDVDQSAAGADQTHADLDQVGAEADQEASDLDRSYAERDQHASDRDQAAADSESGQRSGMRSDRVDEAHAVSRAERESSTHERARTAAARAKTTGVRLASGELRDVVARQRDLTAAARDQLAHARDRAAESRDRAAESRERNAVAGQDVEAAISALRTVRKFGAVTRQQAALERAAAAADRASAAEDRDRAAADRVDSGLDELTGVLRRGTGEIALEHEIARSRRRNVSLTLAMIDVDGLKALNDNEGHAAGDHLLRAVPTAITVALRPYDVTVRWGGDEFVCGLTEMTTVTAIARVVQIQRELELLQPGATISAGLAELRVGDTLRSLVDRADQDLYRSKHLSRPPDD